MMLLLEELHDEHLLVDDVAGSLVQFSRRAAAGDVESSDVTDFVRFFRVFVAGFHHQREEETLFLALVDGAEVPADRGPLPAIAADHREAVLFVDALEAASGDPERAAEIARRFAHHLWEHVDKEESVLLPEARERLPRNGVNRLVGRAPTAEELSARELGEQLTDRFPPLDDPDHVRGAGCVVCAAFGETCAGIETEWWNDWEREYHRSLDEG